MKRNNIYILIFASISILLGLLTAILLFTPGFSFVDPRKLISQNDYFMPKLDKYANCTREKDLRSLLLLQADKGWLWAQIILNFILVITGITVFCCLRVDRKIVSFTLFGSTIAIMGLEIAVVIVYYPDSFFLKNSTESKAFGIGMILLVVIKYATMLVFLLLYYNYVDGIATESLNGKDFEPLIRAYSPKVESVSEKPIAYHKPDQAQSPVKLKPEITIQKPQMEDCDWYDITTTTELDDVPKKNLKIASSYKRISETSKSSLTSLEKLVINHEADIQLEKFKAQSLKSDTGRYMTKAKNWFNRKILKSFYYKNYFFMVSHNR